MLEIWCLSEQVRADFAISPPETNFDVVVLDEAQRVKDWRNTTTVAVARINRNRTWALSGTPLENVVEELQTLIRLIRPGIQLGASQPQVLEALQGHFMRRKKQDVLGELPPIIEQTQLVELTAAQRNAYDAVWEGRYQFAGRDDTVFNGSFQRGNFHSYLQTFVVYFKQRLNFQLRWLGLTIARE